MSRSRTSRTEALVLRRVDFGEADRVLTLFTPSDGKLRAVAKGVRRTTSRSSGHLELFAHSDVLLTTGRDLDLVSQAETIRSFRVVREDLLRTAYAYFMAEIVDALTAERQPNQRLFDATLQALTALDSDGDARLVCAHFLLHALDAAGFRPQLTLCVNCQQALQPEVNAFAPALGGALCPRCAPSSGAARDVPVNVLKLLRLLQRSLHVDEVGVRIPVETSREAERLLRDYAEFMCEQQLRAPSFVARVREAIAAYRTE